MKYNCIVVLGPTASGKTKAACQLAAMLDGEVISADSRQVYKKLNIGTGKDLGEYVVNGRQIPYHLIDIIEPGEQFYLHQFAEELLRAFNDITQRGRLPIICGGTGLYLDAMRKDFSFTSIAEDHDLRKKLEPLTKEELLVRLNSYSSLHIRHVDLHSKKRIIRGIEIAEAFNTGFVPEPASLPYCPLYVGVDVSVGERKEKISQRLTVRISNGLIEEAEGLVKDGLTFERLERLGLEYKFLSQYLQGKITREQLFSRLQTAIHQYAKRQMTWFRKMEKEGVVIQWLKPGNDFFKNVLKLWS